MDKKNITKKYANDDITIVWKPDMCTHSTKCWKGLINVFNPKERPWVKMDGASTEAIIKQVDKCPSAALSYYKNDQQTEQGGKEGESTRVECSPNGPLLVYGELNIQLPGGASDSRLKVTAFCRCGASNNKPYCDGAHRKVNFEG